MCISKRENTWERLLWNLVHLSRLLYIIIFFTGITYAHLEHGAGLQVTHGGTGIFYKELIPNGEKLGMFTQIGLHLQNNQQRISVYGMRNGFQNIYLETSLGTNIKLFNNVLAGAFRPIITCAAGIDFNINPYKKINTWHLKSLFGDAGIGVQFYNGRLLNEILLKYYPQNMREFSLQLSVYWQ